jgi:Ser/Thr protein kinase RdoA (MazF antagonist)
MDTIIKIVDNYDIQETLPQELIRESGDNRVYCIGADNKKILRVSKKLSKENVQFEYEVLQHLARNSFPVPKWVKTKDGNIYASTKEADVAVMFEFLEGYHVPTDTNNLATKKQAYTAGRTLGSLAEIGKTFSPVSFRQRNIFSELERAVQKEDIFARDFQGGVTFIKEVRQAIAFGKEHETQTGLIHNDYRSGNVFFKNDGEISGVIDFDWSCIGPCVKDLALGVMEWSFPDGRMEPDPVVFDAFLEGYNSASTKKYTKNKDLYSWILFAALSDTATFFCDRLGNPEQKKDIGYSYMYRKYRYFSKLNAEYK